MCDVSWTYLNPNGMNTFAFSLLRRVVASTLAVVSMTPAWRYSHNDELPACQLMNDTASPLDTDTRDALQNAVLTRFNQLLAQQAGELNARTALRLAAEACREALAERWAETQKADAMRGKDAPCRRVHYLSMEFLMGRAMGNALAALGLEPSLRALMAERGIAWSDVLESEPDAALGNGGLGRLAACFLDAFA